MQQLEKARLTNEETKESIVFQFNPETIQFAKAQKIGKSNSMTGKGAVQQTNGTDPVVLSLPLLLDDWEADTATVNRDVNLLISWLSPAKSTGDSSSVRPPSIEFSWGEFKLPEHAKFICLIKSADVTYTMFRPNGVPLRAEVTVKLESITKETTQSQKSPGALTSQNPTSGGRHARRSRTIRAGDDLAVVARQEYGNTKHWRYLAALNGIDDPFSVPPGKEVLLPARSELTRDGSWRT